MDLSPAVPHLLLQLGAKEDPQPYAFAPAAPCAIELGWSPTGTPHNNSCTYAIVGTAAPPSGTSSGNSSVHYAPYADALQSGSLPMELAPQTLQQQGGPSSSSACDHSGELLQRLLQEGGHGGADDDGVSFQAAVPNADQPAVSMSCGEVAAFVHSSREEPNAVIRTRLSACSMDRVLAIAEYLVSSPALTLDLCHNYNGNVVVEVFIALVLPALTPAKGGGGGIAATAVPRSKRLAALVRTHPKSVELFSVIMSDALALAVTQSGAAILNRAYNVAALPQRCKMHRFVCANFLRLAVDPWGSALICKTAHHAAVDDDEAIASLIVQVGRHDIIQGMVATESGCHVIDVFLEVTTALAVATSRGVMEREAIQTLLATPYGSRTLQSVVKYVKSRPRLKSDFWMLLNLIPELAQGTECAVAITKTVNRSRAHRVEVAPLPPLLPERILLPIRPPPQQHQPQQPSSSS